MKKERYFNFIYNGDEKLGFGKGYYLYFQSLNDKKEDLFAVHYPIKETEQVDFVSVGVLNQLKYYTDMGWTYNPYYTVDLTKEFNRKED